MILLLVILALMVMSTVLVVAAGMLSSRLSRQEGRIETFKELPAETGMSPEAVD